MSSLSSVAQMAPFNHHTPFSLGNHTRLSPSASKSIFAFHSLSQTTANHEAATALSGSSRHLSTYSPDLSLSHLGDGGATLDYAPLHEPDSRQTADSRQRTADSRQDYNPMQMEARNGVSLLAPPLSSDGQDR
jgi:hypothetical protein